jgi:cell division protein FtsB
MNELKARIKELEAQVKTLNDEVFYWRGMYDRVMVEYTALALKVKE